MSDAPRVVYNDQGEVVSEPDIERRVAFETEEELAELAASSAKGGFIGGSAAFHGEVVKLLEDGGCCARASALRKILVQLGADKGRVQELDCCVIQGAALDIYNIDRLMRGKGRL